MIAVILAGGEGKRLFPLNLLGPKPMTLVYGKPLLEHQIVNLKKAGIRTIVLAIGYKADKIREHFGDGKNWDVEITHLQDLPDTKGSTAAVKNALGWIKDHTPQEENVLVMCGDTMLSEKELVRLMQKHKEGNQPVTLGIVNQPIPFGLATIKDNVVRSLEEKPVLPVSGGICILRTNESISLGNHCDFFGSLGEKFGGRMSYYPFEKGSWLHLTTKADVRGIENTLKKRRMEEGWLTGRSIERA